METNLNSSETSPAVLPQIPFFTRTTVQLLLIALAGLLAYCNTFHVPFAFDDETSIVKNYIIKNWGEFISGAGYSYNPRRFIGYLTIALNYRLGGLDVTGYHIFNLAVHLASAFLVYALVSLTLKTPYFRDRGPGTGDRELNHPSLLPLFAALLFVAHPVQTQAVTYIIQRLASLSTMFYLLSLVLYVKGRQTTSSKSESRSTDSAFRSSFPSIRSAFIPLFYFAGALLSAGLAMKTKEIAFTLPFIVILYESFFFKMTSRKKLLLLLPVIFTIIVVPLSIISTDRPLGELLSDVAEKTRVQTDISRLDYLYTQFRVLATYLRLLFFPVNQNLDYDYPIYHSFFTPPVFLSFLLLLTLFGLAIFLFYRSGKGVQYSLSDIQASGPSLATSHYARLISFGILWFFITLSVESSFIPIVDVIFEHRLYLASPGAFIAVAAFFCYLLRNVPPRRAILVLSGIILLLTGTTFVRNHTWRNQLTLAEDTACKSPGKARPHYTLALALRQIGRIDKAFPEAEIAVRLAPDEANPRNLLGCMYGSMGMYDKSLAELSEAVRLDPQFVEAQINLGDAYRLKGMIDKALEHYFNAVRLTPYDADVYSKIGLAYGATGNMEKSAVFFQCAVSLNPDRPDYLQELQRAKAACLPSVP